MSALCIAIAAAAGAVVLPSPRLTLAWTHSVERTAWEEDYVIAGDRLRVCFDTAHAFAAGYDIRTQEGYDRTFSEFDEVVGIERLAAFHLNDSKKELNSRVDRHDHIGKGHLGVETFRRLLNDKRFWGLPMCLETPKGPELKEDRENLSVLRSLLQT